MGCNLIAITPERFSEALVEQAIAACLEEKKKLIVLLINDPASINATAMNFKQSSPVGNSKAIAESLKSHHKFLLQEDLSSIKTKTVEAQIGYEEIKETGDFEKEIIKTVRKLTPDTLFVSRMETKTSFSRFLRGSVVESLQKNCSCKVVVL